MSYSAGPWRAEYLRCRPEWTRRLRALCRDLQLPDGAFELLSLELLFAGQRLDCCFRFLERARPAAILTEYDRAYLWSCLVLAAGMLGIPSITLVHGAMGEAALFFAPVLADVIICWGNLGRDKLLAAGVPAEKIVIGGCPRLSRDLRTTAEEARRKLALDMSAPVVIVGTSPERQSLQLVESFCTAIENMNMVSGLVRLHPSENLGTYAAIAERHPQVRFSANTEVTLDEALAAADIVVVRGSGMGSDALVKKRPVVVLNSEPVLAGPDLDLVSLGGCPHAKTSDELTDILRRMLVDEEFRSEKATAAEHYVRGFCDSFGLDSARRIAKEVRNVAGGERNPYLTTVE